MEADPNTYGVLDRLCVIEYGRVLAISRTDEIKVHKDVRVSGVFRVSSGGSGDS